PSYRCGFNDGRDRFDAAFAAWEIDAESRSLAHLAVYPDVAAALLHDAKHGREPEARPPLLLLGGEEGLENVLLRRRVHAGSRVGDREHDVATGNDPVVNSRVFGVELGVGRFHGDLAAC